MENYCIKFVEEKMSKFGQKKREAKKSNRFARKELLPESFEEDEYKIVEPTIEQKKILGRQKGVL
jgi:hypothetical protein